MTKKIIDLGVLHKDIKERIKSLSIYPIKSYEILIDELAFLTYCVQKCENIHDDIESLARDLPTRTINDKEHLKMKLDQKMGLLKMQLDTSEKTKYQRSH